MNRLPIVSQREETSHSRFLQINDTQAPIYTHCSQCPSQLDFSRVPCLLHESNSWQWAYLTLLPHFLHLSLEAAAQVPLESEIVYYCVISKSF